MEFPGTGEFASPELLEYVKYSFDVILSSSKLF